MARRKQTPPKLRIDGKLLEQGGDGSSALGKPPFSGKAGPGFAVIQARQPKRHADAFGQLGRLEQTQQGCPTLEPASLSPLGRLAAVVPDGLA